MNIHTYIYIDMIYVYTAANSALPERHALRVSGPRVARRVWAETMHAPPTARAFDESKKKAGAQTVAGLFEVVAQPQVEEPVREQAGVLLRQCLNQAPFYESPLPCNALGGCPG